MMESSLKDYQLLSFRDAPAQDPVFDMGIQGSCAYRLHLFQRARNNIV